MKDISQRVAHKALSTLSNGQNTAFLREVSGGVIFCS